jgi:AraC-like DNA-binding protein
MSARIQRRRVARAAVPPPAASPAATSTEALMSQFPFAGQQPVFNLTRSIALLEASAQSDMAFGTEQQPYPGGVGIRTSFLAGGAPFTPLTKGVSDSYTDLVHIDEGFYLRVIKDSGRQTTHVIVPGEDWLKISFGLEGGITQTFNEETSFRCIGGRIEINLHPPGVIKIEGVEDGCWGSSVGLYLSRSALKPHVEAEMARLPATIAGYLRDGPKELILETVPMTSSIMRAVVDIVNTRYLGRLRHTYVKAKATELLCEVVYLLTHESELMTSDLRLSWRDKRQLDKARQTIREDCVNAPTISELSRQLGLNQRKLKMGFKQLFGTPVFQYTQNLRLEKALQLLQTGDYSIREVADAVGYGYAKNFTTAFKKRYGVSPKVARKSFNRSPAARPN